MNARDIPPVMADRSLSNRCKFRRLALRSLAIVALTAGTLSAQSTQTVPPDDPVYGFIDRLVAARLVDTIIAGHRPLSRREIGRIVAEARGRVTTPWLTARLEEYALAFPNRLSRAERSFHVGTDMTLLDSPSRGIEPDANGHIAVDLNPLAAERLGQPAVHGTTISQVIGGSAAPTTWLTFASQQRFSHLDAKGSSGTSIFRIEQLYARALWRNVAVTAGRDYNFFGQGNTAGLIGSINPRGIDQVRLESDRPFVPPWVFRHMGPTRATLTLGDLGQSQFFPHTRIFSYKLTSRPHPRFEIGAGLSEQVGGQGAPPGTFLQKLSDAFPLIDALILHRNFQFSNKFVAVDLRYTIPGVRGAQFYAEGAFDDFDLRRVRSVFTEDAGYVWGLSGSCFAECGRVRASVEYHVTGLRYYTHGAFRNGYTVDGEIIGDPLGPRGRGAYASVDLDGSRRGFVFTASYEARSGDKYGSVATSPEDADFKFVKYETHPTEYRARAMVRSRFGSRASRFTYTVSMGAERVANFAHVDGSSRINAMSQIGIQFRPWGGH